MSYFSNILTATKSHYQSIRGEGESDGDTEDDSHISQSLRAYYLEQTRPIPDWLGGGPPPTQSLRGTYGQSGGKGRGAPQNASLSDIWDNPGQQGQQLQNSPAGRPRFGSQNQQRPNLFPDEGPPLPQQQQQHHHHQQQQQQQDGPGAAKVLTSAQQRIKERLWGGRTASPPLGQAQKPPPPPMSLQMPGEQFFMGNAAPPAGVPRSRSPAGRPGPGPSGSRGGPPPHQGGGGKPPVSAGMPWDDGGYNGGSYSDGFDGAPGVPGYYGGSSGGGGGGNLRKPPGGGGPGGRVGLPSGPGPGRQGRNGY